MKSIFKIVLIFFALTVSLLLGQSSQQAQAVDITAFIAHPAQETVVLVSNNIFQGEICSSQDETNHNLVGTISAVITEIQPKIFFIENKTFSKGCFIHNLSTNNQKVHQIRAP